MAGRRPMGHDSVETKARGGLGAQYVAEMEDITATRMVRPIGDKDASAPCTSAKSAPQ